MSLKTRLKALETATQDQKTEIIIIEDGTPTEGQEMLMLALEISGKPYRTINIIDA